jgi:hypothetical protein
MIGSGGYVKGDRVRFLPFGEPDPHSRLTAGTEGTVVHVDDLGTVHVQWDDGGRLGMIVDPPAGQPPDRIELAASTREVATGDLRRVRDAMRSGEWLRTQWIARVAFDLGRAPWHPDHQRRIWPRSATSTSRTRSSAAPPTSGNTAGRRGRDHVPRLALGVAAAA